MIGKVVFQKSRSHRIRQKARSKKPSKIHKLTRKNMKESLVSETQCMRKPGEQKGEYIYTGRTIRQV